MLAFRKSNNKLSRLRDDTDGSVFIEAAVVVPLIVLILAAMTEWGLALYQYHLLSTATSQAVRQLIANRGFDDPYVNVLNEYKTWAKTLGVQDNQIIVTVNGKTCSSNSSCKSELDLALGKSASVEVNYPCTMQFTPQIASPCPIKLVMTGLVE